MTAPAIITTHYANMSPSRTGATPPTMTVVQARRILKKYGWTQDDIATALEASLRTVQRWLADGQEYVPPRLAVPLHLWSRFPDTQPLFLRRRTNKVERAD